MVMARKFRGRALISNYQVVISVVLQVLTRAWGRGAEIGFGVLCNNLFHANTQTHTQTHINTQTDRRNIEGGVYEV